MLPSLYMCRPRGTFYYLNRDVYFYYAFLQTQKFQEICRHCIAHIIWAALYNADKPGSLAIAIAGNTVCLAVRNSVYFMLATFSKAWAKQAKEGDCFWSGLGSSSIAVSFWLYS